MTTRSDAAAIIRALAEGRDPRTGQELVANDLFNDPSIIRALFAAVAFLHPAPDRTDPARVRTTVRDPGTAPQIEIPVGTSLEDAERILVQETLAFLQGDKRETAEMLKISLKTLYNKLNAYGTGR